MPLYEYYCDPCNGIFEAIRQMREASVPVPCPVCNRDGERIMSSFNAFTFRDGYPRRIPDKGTYWHMGTEVKSRAKRMKGWEHPELAKPKPKQRPTRGEASVQREKRVLVRQDARYRSRWGIDKDGFPTVKTKVPEKERKVLPAG
ncbi:MAG TPA: zinc ribbon domain-containing protein [Dehalococcoidia bacterium]|nr:zinc ribbon domain-containing protein [Dehalococcoidia bacterium]